MNKDVEKHLKDPYNRIKYAYHFLGTDSAGRDVFARLLFGSRTTFIAAALVSITAIIVGVPAGLVAGYYGGKFDLVASWIANRRSINFHQWKPDYGRF